MIAFEPFRLQPRLLRAGIGFLLAFLACASAIHCMRAASAAASAAERQAATVTQALHMLKSELPMHQAYLEQYRALQQRQLIGPEQRTAWIENLRALRRTYGLSEFEYRFQPQQPLPDHPNFSHSEMQLRMQLLHEGDLLAVLDALERTRSAHVRLRSCTLQRMAPFNEELAPTLQAECLLDWITAPAVVAHP